MVSVRSVQPVLARLRTLGLDVDAVLCAAGGDTDTLSAADGRIPHELALAVWREAELRSGDTAFGLHAAEEIRPGAFDVLDYAIRSSATFGEGLARLVRYHRVLHDAALVRLNIDAGHGDLTHSLPGDAVALPRRRSRQRDPPPPRHARDATRQGGSGTLRLARTSGRGVGRPRTQTRHAERAGP
jgi:hypothetical protein